MSLFTSNGLVLPLQVTFGLGPVANHREILPGVTAGRLELAVILVPPVIPKGSGALLVMLNLEEVLAKATRRGNRCNAAIGGSTVEPAWKVLKRLSAGLV